jgi:hypothetical protein
MHDDDDDDDAQKKAQENLIGDSTRGRYSIQHMVVQREDTTRRKISYWKKYINISMVK